MENKAENQKVVLSASKIDKFLSCSWSYYCTYHLKLPDRTHPKTIVGTLCHAVLEFLAKPLYRQHLEMIVSSRDIYSSSRVKKIIFAYKNKFKIEDDLLKDLNSLIFAALDNDFLYENAKKNFDPEFEFFMDVSEKVSIRGYIDRMAEYDDLFKIRDYKSASKKFTKEKLDSNIQASMYQLAIWKIFSKKAQVEFNFLRFKKAPLCVVQPKDPQVLEGFQEYVKYLGAQMAEMDEQKAKKNFLGKKDQGFCLRVCNFRDPFYYFVVLDESGKIISSQSTDAEAQAIKIKLERKMKNITVEKRQYAGCPFFHAK